MKKLIFTLNKKAGRSRGRVSTFHRSGGVKKQYHAIDFWRYLLNIPGKVLKIERDYYRSAKIATILYSNGYFSYILQPDRVMVGDYVIHTDMSVLLISRKFPQLTFKSISLYLKHILLGKKVSNIEFVPGSGGSVSRSAGTFSFIRKRYSDYSILQLPSGEYRKFESNCFCTEGRVGYKEHREIPIVKAGISARLGKRSIVRGRAMNPVDHPHGGRTNGGIAPRTPWGFHAKGVRTVKYKKGNCIVKRRK